MALPQPEKRSETSAIIPKASFYERPQAVLLDEKQWLYIQRRYHMSPRELEVAKLVCQGFINGEIAKKLNVKPGTVKTHLRSIFGKTRTRNKIAMLLSFMDDVTKFSFPPSAAAPIPITERLNPAPEKPAFGDKLEQR